MSEYRVSARYAKSLLDLATEQNIVEAVLADMTAFAQLAQTNKELVRLLNSPIINNDKKLAVLRNLFENKFQKITMKFFEIIVSKNRESFLDSIAAGFIEQYNYINQITKATVKSASPLSNEALAEVKSHIEKQTGKKVQLTATTNPELIGGIVVQVEDRLFDASIAGKLGKLKNDLLNSYISK